MTEAKQVAHTPGPWTVKGGARNVSGNRLWCGELYPQTAMYRGTVCAIQSADHLGVEAISIEEAEANARLIAAAPDLLDALEEARAFIDGQIDIVDGDYGVPAPNKAMQLAQVIDAALAKAGA